ncbi:hypothetical protein TPHA_0A05930 [Tetrapisispora phaffii CBS 4417]|uniref:GATA-type domain-containing protein n=1 Tax=Tetrapisispora phaffii (strain ATCC 24235 / CBS 4417 / NBRC 1672 / NRRL Y-8282 / UCD 70-5) TaxID=1071381 RepID=G8BP39_TETPH|nr:hypothetical protein TPHA_0A05930 [Tetrapisispora phaffii CBS 4417]CCE61667.1 hypothetical protein TPHA_0A05930 [Tetrapisispora phaffii CBS 4417]
MNDTDEKLFKQGVVPENASQNKNSKNNTTAVNQNNIGSKMSTEQNFPESDEGMANDPANNFFSTSFDSMLEVLPDSMNLDAFSNYYYDSPDVNFKNSISDATLNGNITSNNTDIDITSTTEFIPNADAAPLSEDVLSNVNEFNKNNVSSVVQPIDIVDQQNGEIAQLWDFNIDEFMMTPNGSNSATISAPNSFNSDMHLSRGSAPNSYFIQNFTNNDTLFNNNNLDNNVSSPAMTSFIHNQNVGQSFKRDSLPTSNAISTKSIPNRRRSSSNYGKSLYSEEIGIPLSSLPTSNSVRKNSVLRQMSSSSLSSYKRGANASSNDLAKKPPVQCANCKTFKTPLWRRDAQGNILCNACGLFQKLHGTMRPLSLKSDVIKRRKAKKGTKKHQQQLEQQQQQQKQQQQQQDRKKEFADNRLKNEKSTDRSTKQIASDINNINSHLLSYNNLTNTNIQKEFQTEFQNNLSKSYTDQPALQQPLPGNLSNSTLTKAIYKSRTSSISSNSSKSSSKSVVPILPKPSPIPHTQFNPNIYSSTSANSSTSSSPRVVTPITSGSILQGSQSVLFSNSLGRSGMSIPRRRFSRNKSASTLALNQQVQHNQQNQQTSSQSQNATTPGSWGGNYGGQINSGASPKNVPLQNSTFGEYPPQGNGFSISTRSSSRKPQTSLLSQQLQNSSSQMASGEKSIYSSNESTNSMSFLQSNNIQNISNSPSWKYSTVSASPHTNYSDSIQQQRGLRKEDLYSKHSTKSSATNLKRSEDSFREQSPSFQTTFGNPQGPSAITSVTDTNASAQTENPVKLTNTITDDLDWLKFGL